MTMIVSEEDRCPTCGERQVDYLVWIDDDIVHCVSCGTAYEPGTAVPAIVVVREGESEA